jgi:hypothetical protein
MVSGVSDEYGARELRTNYALEGFQNGVRRKAEKFIER